MNNKIIFENSFNHYFEYDNYSLGDRYFCCKICKIVVYCDSLTRKTLYKHNSGGKLLDLTCEEVKIKELLE